MSLNDLIDELVDLRTKIKTGDIPVFIEVNKQQKKCGNYDFFVGHHFHEKTDEYEEINEVILMPDSD